MPLLAKSWVFSLPLPTTREPFASAGLSRAPQSPRAIWDGDLLDVRAAGYDSWRVMPDLPIRSYDAVR